MKYFIFLIFFINSPNFFAQKTVKSLGFTNDSISINVNIKIKEAISFQGFEIVLEKIISDSRCPKTIKCDKIGEALILMKIYYNNTFVENKIVSVDEDGYIFESNLIKKINQYKIYVSGLYPYPEKENAISKEEYNADFFVKRVYN